MDSTAPPKQACAYRLDKFHRSTKTSMHFSVKWISLTHQDKPMPAFRNRIPRCRPNRNNTTTGMFLNNRTLYNKRCVFFEARATSVACAANFPLSHPPTRFKGGIFRRRFFRSVFRAAPETEANAPLFSRFFRKKRSYHRSQYAGAQRKKEYNIR